MDYLRELKAFYEWQEVNTPSKHAVSLWYALMHINNKAYWATKFTAANSILALKMGLRPGEASKKTIQRARDELVQLGRIEWQIRDGNQSAIYHIIPFAGQIAGQNNADDVPQEDLPGQNAGQSKPENVPQASTAGQNNPENVPQIPRAGQNQPQNVPSTKRNTKYLERNTPLPLTPSSDEVGEGWQDQDFDTFWEAYPKHLDIAATRAEWHRLNPEAALVQRILTAVEAAKRSVKWREEGGRYIPQPAKWLADKRFLDDYAPTAAILPMSKRVSAQNFTQRDESECDYSHLITKFAD